jgi:uncharacterized protein with HEPN domain
MRRASTASASSATSEQARSGDRRLEVVGEAARKTSDDVRAQYPEVPWAQMAGLRNRLAHEYDAVDMESVWLTVARDLPAILELLG